MYMAKILMIIYEIKNQVLLRCLPCYASVLRRTVFDTTIQVILIVEK